MSDEDGGRRPGPPARTATKPEGPAHARVHVAHSEPTVVRPRPRRRQLESVSFNMTSNTEAGLVVVVGGGGGNKNHIKKSM